MKRNRFLTALLLGATAPSISFAHSQSPGKRTGKAFKIAKGESKVHGHLKSGGPTPQISDVKISGKDTDGDLAVFEQTVLAKGANVPLHVHPHQDEVYYVLEGRFRFKAGEEIFELEAGDSIFLPRNLPHAWIVLSETAKSYLMVQPAGKLEEFFVAISNMPPGKRPSAEEMTKLSADHEMIVVGDRLTLE